MEERRCFCPCHRGSLLWYPPVLTHPVEALACCDLCAPLHKGVWRHYKRPRITGKWDDDPHGGQAA